SGRPVSGAVVYAHPDSVLRGTLPRAPSDSNGDFTITVYQTGSYVVTASKNDEGYPALLPFYYPTDAYVPHILIRKDRAAPFVTVRMGPKAGKITGRFVDASTGQ